MLLMVDKSVVTVLFKSVKEYDYKDIYLRVTFPKFDICQSFAVTDKTPISGFTSIKLIKNVFKWRIIYIQQHVSITKQTDKCQIDIIYIICIYSL